MDAVTAFRRLLVPLGCGLVVACGGPESGPDATEYSSSEETLVLTASPGLAAGSAAPSAPSTEPGSPAPAYASTGCTAAPVAYLVNGDSSPDPIPARTGDDTRKSAGAVCDEAFPPGWWRDACHRELDRP